MIVFKSIEYKNFMSVGKKPITVLLNDSKVLVISGKNGHGKSALLAAIYYALYGKSFSGVNLSSLINSINKKELLVTLELEVNNVPVVIKRGMKPNVFEIYINGKLKPQNASVRDYQNWLQNELLKMDEKTFRQVVTMGSTSYIPFMKLSAAERRIVIEDLLRIDIISAMNVIAKERNKKLQETCSSIVSNISVAKTQLEAMTSSIDTVNANLMSQIERVADSLSALKDEANQTIAEIETLREKSNESLYKELSETHSKILDLITDGQKILYAKQQKLDTIQKNLDFFAHTDTCPVCTQPINHEFVAQKRSELTSDAEMEQSMIDEIENSINTLNERARAVQSKMDELYDVQVDLNHNYEKIKQLKEKLNFYVNEKQELESKMEAQQTDMSEQIEQKQEQLRQLLDEEKDIQEKLKSYGTILKLLKDDGIKTVIVKNYLGIINALIKKYLDIINFNVSFVFDENFVATIKSRNRDVFEYNSFSEGERLRIDYCLLFAFRELARLRSTVNVKNIIIDEQDGRLDSDGTQAINALLKSLDANIIIISQYVELYDEIATKQIKMEKTNHFTHMIEL